MIMIEKIANVTVEVLDGNIPKFTARLMNGNEDIGPCVFRKSTVEWLLEVRESSQKDHTREVPQTEGKSLRYEVSNTDDGLDVTSHGFVTKDGVKTPMNSMHYKISDTVLDEFRNLLESLGK